MKAEKATRYSMFGSFLSAMELQFLTFIFTLLVFLFFLIYFVKHLKTHKRMQELPPGPLKLPLIGSMLSLSSSKLPHHVISDLANKYGPLMHLQLGEVSTIVISSPRIAKEVMKTHDLAFASRGDLLVTRIVFYNNTDIAFAPYGAYWRQMRKVCILQLLSAKKVQEFCPIREDEVWHLIDSIHSSVGSPTDITKKIYKLSNTIAFRAVFGEHCKNQETILKVIQDALKFMAGFHVADLFPSWKFLPHLTGIMPKLVKLRQNVDEMFDNLIMEHLKKEAVKEEDEDLLDVLLRIKATGELEFPLTFDNIKAVILDMFSAGTDTSSTILEWAMSELIRNPRVMHKAQEELRQALKGKKIVSEKDIRRLPYLNLIIKETLRLRPPVPLGARECIEACEVDGYRIPVKTKVIVNAWALGRDPDYWHDPERFEPERFDNSSIDFRGTHFEYIPFGTGKRICPGMTFGMANVELTLAQLLYHFDWKLPGNIEPEDLDMAEELGITVKRKNNLVLIATPHSTSLDCS